MDIAGVLEEYLADLTSLPGDIAFVLDEIKVKDEKLLEVQKRIHQRDTQIQKYVKTNGAMQESPKEQSFYPRIRSDFQECISLQQDKTKLAVMGLYLVTKHVNTLDSHVSRLEAEGQLAPIASELEDSATNSLISSEPYPKIYKKPTGETVSRRASRPETVRDRTPISTIPKSNSHSRSNSTAAAIASDDNITQRPPVPGSLDINPATDSEIGNKSIFQTSPSDEGQRQALELNGARLSLKRNYQSPRQRPMGFEERDEAFCYCKKGSVGNMIACDGDSCEIEWFHWECVGLTEDPKGSWYCPECREKIKKQAR